MNRGSKLLYVQGLRGIALLAVVLYHFGFPLPNGFVGVDVFFVISGFVITLSIQRRKLDSLNHVAGFYWARFRRLAPALAALVSVVSVIGIFVLSPQDTQPVQVATGLGSMLGVSNFVLKKISGDYFSPEADTNPLLHTWSLSVEEQFYLVFPLILFLITLCVKRTIQRRRVQVAASILLFAISIAVTIIPESVFSTGHIHYFFGYFGPIPRFWEFLAGAILAQVLPSREQFESNRFTRLANPLGWTLFLGSLFINLIGQPYPGVMTLAPVAGTSLLIVAAHSSSSSLKLLESRPMIWLGDRSYSLYLWHWPIFVFTKLIWPIEPVIQVTVSIVLTLVLAMASYKFIELPLQTIALPNFRSSVAFVTSVLLIPGAALGVVKVGSDRLWFTTWAQPQEMATVAADLGYKACSPNESASSLMTCFAPLNGVFAKSVAMVGDSQAGVYSSTLLAAFRGSATRVLISSRPGCPFIDAPVTGDHIGFDCGIWQKQVLKQLEKIRPELVVIANRTAGYIYPALGWRTVVDKRGRAASTTSQAVTLFRVALARSLHALTKEKLAVILVGPLAEPTKTYSEQSLLRKILPPNVPDTFRKPTTKALDKAKQLLLSLTGAHGKVAYFPVQQSYCSGQLCLLKDKGEDVFLDVKHLSVFGAEKLAPSLKQLSSTLLNAESRTD